LFNLFFVSHLIFFHIVTYYKPFTLCVHEIQHLVLHVCYSTLHCSVLVTPQNQIHHFKLYYTSNLSNVFSTIKHRHSSDYGCPGVRYALRSDTTPIIILNHVIFSNYYLCRCLMSVSVSVLHRFSSLSLYILFQS